MQAEIDAQLATIATLKSRLSERLQAAEGMQAQLGRLRAATDGLEKLEAKALAAMNIQYQRIVEDPSRDLGTTQAVYRDAREMLTRHQDTIAAKQREIEQTTQQIENTTRESQAADHALANSRRGFDQARAERLYLELNVAGEIQLSNVIRCEPDETIAACMKRGEQAAAREAETRFKNQVFAAATEADTVARHRSELDTDAEPELLESSVIASGFRGQGDYFVEMSATLRNAISRPQACQLLGLTTEQCGSATTARESRLADADQKATADVVSAEQDSDGSASADRDHRLTVRSNVYYDEVYIDGVAFGSTKLDVMLPAGEYDLEVRKLGHTSYKERIRLDRTRTVMAELAELDSQ